ncbi:aspartate aminotransferase family protein [Telmatospirillum sp. J64-1]|uniref:aspartate aminotransferase family protein n=1 Tax=Telmatospirillum sp. J64-1 TaxID=2502183 RepID=UPI00115E2AD6|nr:aspartate aminotransferase family protein [Telmatospirillum sp. J64-1]
MTSNSIAEADKASLLHPYTNLVRHQSVGPLVITRGEGVYVFDEQGRAYIEGMAGLWCTALGWGEERLAKAAADQMMRLGFYHGFTHKSHDPMIRLAEKLLELAPVPMSKVFFANSGSEANDTAIKMVWYYNNALDRPRKKKIISRLRGYHGVTVAVSSLTALPHNQRGFDAPTTPYLQTDCPHYWRHGKPGESEEDFATRLAENLEKLILAEGPDTVAALIAEPVMGAGGVIVPPATYFEKIQAVLRKYDVLLIADEVICGFGRTGARWGSETFGLKPDILTMAKALSSGYAPISALMLTAPLYDVIAEYSDRLGLFGHGYTYSGHPVSAAVALETLAIYEERDILGHVAEVAPVFQQGLRRLADHPLVGEARGVGLVGAVELVKDKASRESFDPALGLGPKVVAFAQEQGLITRAMGDVIAMSPPLVIKAEEVRDMLSRLERALDLAESWVAANA